MFSTWFPGIPGDVGECPRLQPDAVGHCALYCESDTDCGRGEKCCSNGCGRVCRKVILNYQTGQYTLDV